ncbi:hypothetical protein [Reinekea sp. G2M2-21]|nr:hypothetical protein [Reinekea sp. G2M2-21]MDX1340924.1 hypothetical protein [Reinekea sp.]
MPNRSLAIKQQQAYRQILALTVVGGAVILLLGTMIAMMYLQ